MIELKPQAGPQEMFLASNADIALYGGSAGGGKSFAILLESIRHSGNKDFTAVIFRRTSGQIMNAGGLWDEALKMYMPLGADAKLTPRPMFTFPTGGKVTFAHLQYDSDVHSWQGSQVPLIIFDELTHFTKFQFFYMMSRNRSTCGVRPYIRATTNPDAESWVSDFIDWWIGSDGLPIKERSGVVRFFTRLNDVVIWGDSREELAERYNVELAEIKSFTFISSSIFDNKILLEKDPGYLANLKALPLVERERLLGGNWKIKPAAGLYFKRSEVTMLDAIPNDVIKLVRAWDLAATEKTENNPSPDYTAGVLMGIRKNGHYVVCNAINDRKNAADVRELIKRTASNDGRKVKIRLPQDPGQAGKDQAQSYVKMLTGFSVKIERPTGDKITRAEPLASQWQIGNIDVVRGIWNDDFFATMEGFPDLKHDKQYCCA